MIRRWRRSTLVFCFVSIVFFLAAGCIDTSSPSPGIQQNISSISESPTATIQETPVSPANNSSHDIIIPPRPDPQLLEQERQAIIAFSGDKTLNPVFLNTINYSYGLVDSFDTNNAIYSIERNTGQIHFESYTSKINLTPAVSTISFDQGYLIAEAYARAKAPEIWMNTSQYVMKIKSPTETDWNNGLEYTWRQYYMLPIGPSNPLLEIRGYNEVGVTLDPRDGAVISYNNAYLPLDANLNLTPDLTEEQAWGYAKKFYENNGINVTDNVNKMAYGLSIMTDENNTQHLTWKFYVQTTVNRFADGGMVWIDAHNGNVVLHAMIA